MIIDRAVELAEAGFAWYWEALSVPEKVVFSAVAEAQKIAIEKKDQQLEKNPLMLLQSHDDVLSRDLQKKLTKELASKGFLNEQGSKVKIELVRRWLIQRHPLWHEIRELEKRDKQEVKYTYETRNQIPETSQNQKQSNMTQSTALSQHPQKFEQDVSSVKTSKDKVHQNRGEIWLLTGIIFLGAAAIATFVIMYNSAKQNNGHLEKKQSLMPTAISTTSKV
ncbi:MAG: hypothetical protein V7L22_00820 [Nostoc sp.]|uniref:hypothetical protein n=1 Tax=Nostoc sp. TaxID=1180 RepID=UPI002FF56C68